MEFKNNIHKKAFELSEQLSAVAWLLPSDDRVCAIGAFALTINDLKAIVAFDHDVMISDNNTDDSDTVPLMIIVADREVQSDNHQRREAAMFAAALMKNS